MKVLIDDTCYHVELCGEGFPLLLLHGFTGDASTWTPFCGQWGQHSKLIMPDIIGHGQTGSPNGISKFKIEAAATDLKTILEKLELDKVDVLGYSMGGRLALTFAILFPDMVRKLVLESASPGLETEKERNDRRIKDAELANLIKEKGIESFIDYWESIPLFSTMKELPLETRMEIRRQRLRNSHDGLANSLNGMGTGSQPSWWRELGEINSPVLLLSGDQDEKFCGIAKRMTEKIKNAKWTVIRDSGHAIHVEKKEKFGTIVSDFLKNT